MCIAILSTAHPDYSLILLSNRDEYLARPTAPLGFWSYNSNNDPQILSGHDLQSEAHGTWLGITRTGRLTLLTNFREEAPANGTAPASALASRGEISKIVLGSEPQRPVADVVLEMVQGGVQGVGGFSLIFGDVSSTPGRIRLGLISNRSRPDESDAIRWLCGEGEPQQPGKAFALSNSHYGDRAWPKVVEGERLLDELVARSVGEGSSQSKEELIGEALELLSTNNLPPREKEQEWEVYLRQLRNSIFIPVIGGDGIPAQDLATAKEPKNVTVSAGQRGVATYATQKQSVILIAKSGEVTFHERTLFDAEARPVKEDRRFDFVIEQPTHSANTPIQ